MHYEFILVKVRRPAVTSGCERTSSTVCRSTQQLTFYLIRALLTYSILAGGQGQGRTADLPLFQELYHPESIYLEKAPAAQLTRIHAADRVFSVR